MYYLLKMDHVFSLKNNTLKKNTEKVKRILSVWKSWNHVTLGLSTTNEKPLKGNYCVDAFVNSTICISKVSLRMSYPVYLGKGIACRLWPSRASRYDIGSQSWDSPFDVMVCSRWSNEESRLRQHPCISTVSVNEHFHASLFHPLYFPASWLCLRWCEYTTSGCLLQSDFLTFETIVASDFGNEKYACSNRAFGSRAESAVSSLKILCEWCDWISDEKWLAFSCRYLSCCGSTGFNISYPGSQHCRSRTLQHCSWCAENIAGQTVQLNLWGKW